MADANLNVLWARAITEELVRGGVRHAVVCPGSRSTPLALACAANPGLIVTSVIDERSAAFVALGIAKESGRPAALVATSGSAGAHFLPAAIEATLSGVPLIALLADRPHELQGFGAPQTIPQLNLFGDFAVHAVDLGLPEATGPVILHLRANVARAVALSQGASRGAVLLNVPLREPLAPVPVPFGVETLPPLAREGRVGAPFIDFAAAHRAPAPQAQRELAEALLRTERGVIVVGPRDADDGLAEALAALSQATGYPILAEATSQLRFGASDHVVAHTDALVRHAPFAAAARPELVLRFGGGLTAKTVQAWLDGSGASIAVFSESCGPKDPAHAARWILEGDAVAAVESLVGTVTRGESDYTRLFLRAESTAASVIEAALDHAAPLDEPSIARTVAATLPEGACLFVSSSMPIRALDAFSASGPTRVRALASRGANGIDGILSTGLGIAVSSKAPTVVLTGDVAFLHDVGGLLTAARSKQSLTVVVVNNDGGGIFSFLPIAEVGSPAFEPLIATPHGVDLSHAAALYGAKLHRPATREALVDALLEGLEGGLHVIEVRLERADNVRTHRGLYARVAKALGEVLGEGASEVSRKEDGWR